MLWRLVLGICGPLLVLLPASIPAGEKAGDKAAWKPITISWHGQSFFILQSSKGTRIAFDPHLIQEYGRPQGLKADVVLMSHNHDDHTAIEAFENAKKIRVIRGLNGMSNRADWSDVDETIGDVHIRSVGLFHDDSQGLERGKNTAFVLEIDGWRIAHLGDVGHLLTESQLKKLGEIDVLMIPVGGVFTVNGSEARKIVAQIKPKEYIFPMHMATKVFDDLLGPAEFLEDQDRSKIAPSDDNKITLNRDPDRPRPLIVLLNYAPKLKR